MFGYGSRHDDHVTGHDGKNRETRGTGVRQSKFAAFSVLFFNVFFFFFSLLRQSRSDRIEKTSAQRYHV